MRSRTPRPLAFLLAAVLALPGCSTWQTASEPVVPLLASPDPPQDLLVKLRDGSSFRLKAVSVVGDSLQGEWFPRAQRRKNDPVPGTRTSVALADIQSVEVSKFDPGLTVGLVALVVAGLVVVVFAPLAEANK